MAGQGRCEVVRGVGVGVEVCCVWGVVVGRVVVGVGVCVSVCELVEVGVGEWGTTVRCLWCC